MGLFLRVTALLQDEARFNEALAFVDWLLADNFTLMGLREMRWTGKRLAAFEKRMATVRGALLP